MIITTIDELRANLNYLEKNLLDVSETLINWDEPEESPVIKEIIKVMIEGLGWRLGAVPKHHAPIDELTIHFWRTRDPRVTQVVVLIDLGYSFQGRSVNEIYKKEIERDS